MDFKTFLLNTPKVNDTAFERQGDYPISAEAQHQIEDFVAFIKTRYPCAEKQCQPEIIKCDKNIDPTDLFGLWAKHPKNLTDIRKRAWQRSELK